ncbi:MAG: stage V sporulation protein AB [Muribaculum sp.]|nr:stage V sporulation protein AB [Muribaculum sp.]
MRSIFLAVVGTSFGLLAAAGVFTVLVAVGLVPRFAGKMHLADKVVLFEEMVIFGSIAGGFVSLFPEYSQLGTWLRGSFPAAAGWWSALGTAAQGVFGLFSGMFIGCLALAIAEMLDSVPIFARRISFRHGLGFAVLGMAAGKLCGSLFYFWKELHLVVR